MKLYLKVPYLKVSLFLLAGFKYPACIILQFIAKQ